MTQQNQKCQDSVTQIQASLEPVYRTITLHRKQAQPPPKLLLNTSQLALFCGLAGNKYPSGLAVVINDSARSCTRFAAAATAWSQAAGVSESWHVISRNLTEQELTGDAVSDLSKTIHHLLLGTPGHHVVVAGHALDVALPNQDTYQRGSLQLVVGEQHSLQELLHYLTGHGFVRYEGLPEPGGVRVRGEQLEVRHPALPTMYTVTFHGRTIESITEQFTAEHRAARRRALPRVTIPPVAFPTPDTALQELLADRLVVAPQGFISKALVYDAAVPTMAFPWQPAGDQPSTEQILWYTNHDRVAAYAADRLADRAVTLCPSPLAALPLNLENGSLRLQTEAHIFQDAETPRPISREYGLELMAELTPGKPAVHVDHGIGIFEGLVSRTIGDHTDEYLLLRYADGDSLSVPVPYAHKVTPYIGEAAPIVHRLGGRGWAAAKKAARAEAEAFARELLAIAGQRANTAGHVHPINEALEETLEASFPYDLTPDQEQVWEVVQDDLQRAEPMDRLIVGDVGFGKTEVAMRAAAHVAAGGSQVAVLAPTTLLVQQHADTFRSRLTGTNLNVAVLSRFATAAEARRVRQQIASGEVNIVIGTHTLLSRETAWHSLGLVVIDEEQRFGVSHKEHFKKLRAELDILSLSATPIPRTLSMALSGLKNLSVISTPPPDRKPIESFVGRLSDERLTEALAQELARGGQAYVVAPKVRQLAALANQIKKCAPTASVGIAHGQLPPRQLADIMARFDRGELDVLVSSTIIENGIDLPNANTIIVTQATHFGLADLYQLRGRVGRRQRRGYAWFFYNQEDLTPVQRQRLTALTEASGLGTGWLLAQRDLEIRGAGNILGAEQSGAVSTVGVQLYLDLVQEAVHRAEHTATRPADVDIRLPLTASIPPHYVADPAERTRLYQLLGRSATPTDVTRHYQNIIERYGAPPVELAMLHKLLLLQHTAAGAGISLIDSQTIEPADEEPYVRLQITGRNLPELVHKLSAVGTWTARGSTLTRDIDELTPAVIVALTKALSAS